MVRIVTLMVVQFGRIRDAPLGRNAVPKKTRFALLDLLTQASSAARIVGHLDDCDGSTTLEQLSDHIDALVHGLGELLGEHRVTAELVPDHGETDMVGELRQLMARADALAWTTDEQFSRIVVLADGDDRPGFRRLAHLVEMTALAVSAALEASSKLIETLERDPPQERA
jgi:hypothetical protein